MRQIIRHKQPVMSKVVPNQGNYQWIAKSVPGGGPWLPPIPAVLFLDSMTDTNGVLLENHVPDIDFVGSGWEKLAVFASTIIDQNHAQSQAINSHYRCDVGTPDQSVTLTTNAASGNGGPLCRVQAAEQFWFGVLDGASTAIQLYENNNSYVLRASTPSVSPATWTMTLEAKGDDITVSANGDTAGFTSALFNTVTFAGSRNNNSGWFDDYQVIES